MLTSLIFLAVIGGQKAAPPPMGMFKPFTLSQLSGVSTKNRPTPIKYVLVDLSKQRLYAFEGLDKVMEFRVSTGATSTPTPVGSFQIKDKQLMGKALPKYGGDKLPFAQRLRGHILIHSYKSVPDYPASHGCIRMLKNDARRLYNWTRVGTRVEVVAKSDDCLL